MLSPKTTDEPRIALACSGLGEVRRGYERYFEELYLLTRRDIPAVLFKGGLNGPGIRLPLLSRKSHLSRIFGSWDSRYKLEVLSFGAALIPSVMLGRFDLLHFADYSLGSLGRLPKWLFRPAILYTNGSQCSPEAYSRFDYVHLVNPVNYLEALSSGIPEDRLFMIPHGVDVGNFRPVTAEAREELRDAYHIPTDDFVVVSVGYMGEDSVKRFQRVILETAGVDRDPFLVLVGEQDRSTASLIEYAHRKLGKRVRIMSLPIGDMPNLYSLADLFVLGSLREAFGIVLIEAMASELPVVAHDHPVIRWVVGDGGSIVDMTEKTNLAQEIQYYMDNSEARKTRGKTARRRAIERFSWENLKPHYLEMYRTCLGSL